jgi:GNAT superfamily N-acetyltransferase
MNVNSSIRPAVVGDAGAILRLIHELAAYEKLSHACVATEELLEANLFGAERAAEAMVAEMEGRIVGYAIYFKTFSTFLALPGLYLEDIYVQPEYRGRGLGKGMLRRLAQVAVERGYGRMEWSVLNWNEPSIGFYKSLGAAPMEGWSVYRLAGGALERFGAG